MSLIVYALRLSNNKFYIGSTYNIYVTLKHVFSKKHEKNQWLKLYEPKYVDKIIHNCYPDDEYKYLIEYIRKYGVENVRGPRFDSFVHEQESLKEIIEKVTKNKI